MQLRSGTLLAPVDKFLDVLNKDKNRWPTAAQARSLSTKAAVWSKFEGHVLWLVSYTTPYAVKHDELKGNRLILMVTLISTMNTAHHFAAIPGFSKFIDAVFVKLGEPRDMPGFMLYLVDEFKFTVEVKPAAAKTIQNAFRKSRAYAEWAWHPDRLKLQGYFDNV
jgi:hypothetical protein